MFKYRRAEDRLLMPDATVDHDTGFVIGGGYFDPYNYGYRSIFDGCYEKMAGFTDNKV